jgi:hypothetical protein
VELLNKIVIDMLREHEGGEKFFDALDANLQNGDIVHELWRKVPDCKAIVSGKFGRFFMNLYPGYDTIVVNGGLRKGPIDSLEYIKDSINGRNFIFIDDSFYLGRTRDKIKAEIEKWGGRLIGTYVIYDGSRVKDETVTSLFRYYGG